jgi:dimethylamine--corrinoid protein Co-methyltransferase
MASTHALASGMGGMRTAGDLVARMQMTRGMRLPQAKQYVADKLGCSVLDLSDTVAMYDIRRDLGLGRIPVQDLTYAEHPGAMEAKFHIADVLDIPINCVRRFKEHAGLA